MSLRAPLTRLGVLTLLLLGQATACGDSPLGLGIGLPPFAERPAMGPSGLVLSRAYVPPAGSSAAGFVELYNGSGSAVDLARTPLTLESMSASVALDSGSWAVNSVLQVTGPTFAALGLHAQAGELMLLDSNLTVAAYGAWGNDPNETLGSFASFAQSSGQSAPWRALPFPLADGQAIALDAGRPSVVCADANLGAAYPPAAASCAAGVQPEVWVSRVVPQGLDPNGSALELYNAGTAPVDVWGLKLCRASGCTALYPHAQMPNDASATVLAPKSTLATGALDAARRRIVFVDGIAETSSDLLTTLTPIHSTEELALAAPGNTTAAAMSYVRITPPGQAASPPTLTAPLVPSAVAAAWQTGLNPPRIAGEALALAVGATQAPSQPSAWRLSALPFGRALSDPNAPWDACSAPQTPAPASMVIDQVVPWDADGTTLVALTNVTSATFVGANLSLLAGAINVSLGAPSLAPNQTLWVGLTAAADCSQLGVGVDVCAPGVTQPLAAQEFALENNHALVSYVQWGTQPQTAHSAAAVAAGVWPGASCSATSTPSFLQVQRLVRLTSSNGQSPADYVSARLLPVP